MQAFAEMSLDARLAYGFHLCMVLLFFGGGTLLAETMQPQRAVGIEIAIAIVLACLLIGVSVMNRRVYGWRWPGARMTDAISAVALSMLMAAFLFAVTPLFPPTTPTALPWYLGGLAFALWSMLQALHVVAYDQTAFEAACRGERAQPPPVARDATPEWKHWVKALVLGLFVASWLAIVFWFYSYGAAIRDGVYAADGEHATALSEHGRTVYVANSEAARLDIIRLVALGGVPFVALLGGLLQFALGVPIFDEPKPLEVPTPFGDEPSVGN